MCGIAGALLLASDGARSAVEAMNWSMLARGPDDGGVELFRMQERNLALGSRRLAIIDPSDAGHQPMLDPSRGTALVFNGMIYNFRELRRELEGSGERFESHCDTEVVLRAYGAWGDGFVARLEGMFALALFDGPRQRLLLARDRLGIKPLYLWQTGEDFVFASQVRALLASGLVPRRFSLAGVASYLATGAVCEPHTAIDGVHALPAGHVGVLSEGQLKTSRYWHPPVGGEYAPFEGDAADRLRALADASVERHLVSDRPTGVFLSGGLDSSLLSALAARRHAGVRTISVMFEEEALSEGAFARAVAESLGTQHTEVVLTQRDFRAALDGAFAAMDQPTFDGINTYVVSRAAASAGLKVALSGLGADELFDGYGHVRRIELLERASHVPRPFGQTAARLAAPFTPPGSRGAKARIWLSGEMDSAYNLLRGLFTPREVAMLAPGVDGLGRLGISESLPDDRYNRVSILDLTTYMRNVLLRDTDAMSMANSLEVRVPYLDDPFVTWALQLPGALKGRSKAILVAAAGGLLPAATLRRRKQGFLLPIASWLRSEVGHDVGETLSSTNGALPAVLDRGVVATEWQRFAHGGVGWLRPWALYALARWAAEVGVA